MWKFPKAAKCFPRLIAEGCPEVAHTPGQKTEAMLTLALVANLDVADIEMDKHAIFLV